MKKKIVYSILLTVILACTAGCGGKDSSNESNTNSKKVTSETTATPEPLPTAETKITEDGNGNNICENKSDGYTVSYEKDCFEMTSEGHSISIKMPGKNKNDSSEKNDSADNKDSSAVDDSYMNVFCTITTSTDISADDYYNSLQTAYKGKYKKKTVTIGNNKTKAVQYVISEGGGMRHEMYVIKGNGKVYMIELKCSKSHKKEYNNKLNAILDSLSFS